MFTEKPKAFESEKEAMGIYLQVKGKILLLQRAGFERGFWTIPGGRREKPETPRTGALRELFEETGILLEEDVPVQDLGSLWMSAPAADYVFHVFYAKLSEQPKVQVSDEHLDFCWCSLEKVDTMPLMTGGLQVFQWFQQQL